MRKIFILPLTILMTFFLFTFSVSALSTTISDPTVDLLDNSDVATLKSYAENYISTHPDSFYFIYYRTSNQDFRLRIVDSYNLNFPPEWLLTSSSISFSLIGTSNHLCGIADSVVNCTQNSGSVSQTIYITNGVIGYYSFLVGNIEFPIHSNIETSLDITYNGNTYSFAINDTLPSLADLLDTEVVPPEPEDNTPLLTSFFSIVIDKLVYCSEYFVNNYVFLYIFSFFILFAIFLLIKRRF